MTSGIIEILTDSAAVQTAVGKNKLDNKWKVYPTVCPQPEDQPYIVVAKTSNSTESQGKEIDSTLDYPSYDVLCYAKNYRKTEEMNEAVRTALDNKSSVTAVCTFRRIWLSTDSDRWDNNLQLYVHIATYRAEQLRDAS